jgi:YidC/Oxa1 family membrane protein insertase
MFPLRYRSMVSMRKMQGLQPKVKAIQERYKTLKFSDPDKQKMNAEMMALYKENGVKPASGCVPMIMTFPVLFAFYRMLVNSIELRDAPFFGWIHNLAAHDPYYITPILMGGTMFWQQRTMPSTGDAMQQKMMMFMPLVFVFTFLWLPSGVVLYYLATNLIGIGQQTITNRLIGAPVARPASTASERRVKRITGPNKQE